MAMLATSASAWARADLAVGKSDGLRMNRLRQPRIRSLSRSGTAHTDGKPARTLSAANCGHGDADVEVGVADDAAGVEAVEARTLVVLDLEQLEQADLLGRGADHPEMPIAVGQQDPGGGSLQQLDAARGQRGEHLDHVEVVDERVDDLDEGRCSERLSVDGPLFGIV